MIKILTAQLIPLRFASIGSTVIRITPIGKIVRARPKRVTEFGDESIRVNSAPETNFAAEVFGRLPTLKALTWKS